MILFNHNSNGLKKFSRNSRKENYVNKMKYRRSEHYQPTLTVLGIRNKNDDLKIEK
jgi:hypothetical protein